MTKDNLTEQLLQKPTAPAVAKPRPTEVTKELTVSGNTADLTIPVEDPELTHAGTGLRFLQAEGLNPDEWEETHFRRIEYGGTADGAVEPRVSVKFSYRRIANLGTGARPPIDDLIAGIKRYRAKAKREDGDHGALVLLGDMQFGKIDGDGTAGTLARTLGCLDRAADSIETFRKRFDIGAVHVGWLGDHVEGFTSQGGANVFRTPLTLNEQIRLVRRVMSHALQTFAPMAENVSMAAVPGNHGEPQRFAGKGVTRYDDSHDTESLIAVSEAAAFNEAAFGHVKFYVPETDELTVVTEVANTIVAHAHGHQWRVNKALDWWKGQAFHTPRFASADLLVAGHLHHLHVEHDGPRTFLQVPSLESESTWYRHSTGTVGNPGIVLAIVKDGQAKVVEFVQ